MRRFLLPLTVFVCGFVVMVLEIVGSRLLAPYVGTSLYVWTSLIGVILGSLSLGYWLGGRAADKKASTRRLAAIIFLAAGAIALIATYQTLVLTLFSSWNYSLRLTALLSALVLFTAPNILLGMVSPYAARLQIVNLNQSGMIFGSLSALSTIGSIVGTFTSGFWLLSFWGHTKILFFLAIVLAAVSLLLAAERYRLKLLVIAGCVAAAGLSGFFIPSSVLADIDSSYNRLLVVRRIDPISGRPILGLTSSAGSLQSAMFADNDTELVFDYSKLYRLAQIFNPYIKEALLIGGGAYSYPKDFLKQYPGANLKVVEIDPSVTALAREFFHLPDSPRLTIEHADARVFLRNNKDVFDVIFGDSFKSQYDVPYSLTTVEAVQSISDHLSPHGVYLINIISALKGDKSKFFQAEYATFKQVFPQVLVFQVYKDKPVQEVQNIMLVGLKSSVPPVLDSGSDELKKYLDHQVPAISPSTVPPLTDEFAPVENYIADLIQ